MSEAIPYSGPACPRRCTICCDHDGRFVPEHHWMLEFGDEEDGTFKEEGFLVCKHCDAKRDLPIDDDEFLEAFNL